MRRDYGGNRAIINAIISCVNGNNRNSKEKHLRDTNNYRAVAHMSVNAVCI